MTATEFAWAAGFFDGEGTTHASRTGPYCQLFVSVQQSEVTTLERLRAALGVGHIYPLAHRPNGLAKKPQFRWQAGRRAEAMFALGLMWPYLSEPKREQANRALSILRQTNKERADRDGTRPARRTPEGAH